LKIVAAALLCLTVLGCQSGSKTETVPPLGDGSQGLTDHDAGRQAPGKVVYSWMDDQGAIRMASRVEDIPEAFRDKVLVTDTARPREQRLKTKRVMLIDLRQEGEDGPVNYTLVDLDKLSRKKTLSEPKDTGELGIRAVAEMARATRQFLGLSTEVAGRSADVILYTAPWCGFCKKAADHLRQKGIAFEERDIDNDRQAALELSNKLREAGLKGGGVPVLDIAGTIVIGFKKERIDSLVEKL
jgi:glutaredoxin